MKTSTARRKSPVKITIDKELDKLDTSAFNGKFKKGNELLKKSPIRDNRKSE